MKHKSTGTATVLSFFWPGVGQIYNGQIFKGLLFGFFQISLGIVNFFILFASPVLFLFGSISLLAFWINGMYDAHQMAQVYNDYEKLSQWKGTGKGFGILFGIWIIGVLLIIFSQSFKTVSISSLNLPAVLSGYFQIPTSENKSQPPPAVTQDESYFQYVKLENLSDAKKGIYGSVKNTGSRTLKRVEVTTYFLDKKGQRIGESTHGVVSESDDSGSLKPGYIRDFGFRVEDDAPSAWSEKFEATVSKIEFA
jgi:TM2 domain-containing membrane protein YozV